MIPRHILGRIDQPQQNSETGRRQDGLHRHSSVPSEDSIEIFKRRVKITSPEKNPGQGDEVKRAENLDRAGQRRSLPEPEPPPVFEDEFVDNEIETMQSSPYYECPICAVPETANQHGQQQVAISLRSSLAVASHRYVDIVPQPCGQGDVPAFPKFTDAAREVRLVEIFHQLDPQ